MRRWISADDNVAVVYQYGNATVEDPWQSVGRVGWLSHTYIVYLWVVQLGDQLIIGEFFLWSSRGLKLITSHK